MLAADGQPYTTLGYYNGPGAVTEEAGHVVNLARLPGLHDQPAECAHTGLDQDAGEILDQILRDVALEGRTVVMTSHDLVRSAGLADKVVLLSKGTIARSAITADLDPAGLIDFYRSGLGEGGGA